MSTLNRRNTPAAALLALAALSVSCGGGGGGGSTPTSPSPPASFLVATNSIFSADRQGTFTTDFDSRMELDGLAVANCQPTTLGAGHCGFAVRNSGVRPGSHRIAIVVTRQARTPADYRYYGSFTVINELTGVQEQAQEFSLRGRLRTGQSLDLQITVP